MPANSYRICSRCVMDTHDINISFDDEGRCNLCTEYLGNTHQHTYKGAESDAKLAVMVDQIKKAGKGKKYDCIIGVSGGVDSIYLTMLAVKWGLRPLAVHMDNGWNARVAVENIKRALDKLGVDLETEVLDWLEFRDLQLSFLKASVPEAENPTDMAIQGVLHKAARKFHVKYILSGGNFVTEGILPKFFQYNPKDYRYMKAIHRRFGSVKLRTFPAFGFRHEFINKVFFGKRILYPLNHISYNKDSAVEILGHELGWEAYGEKHHESVYTKFVQSYWLPEKFNIDYRKATFSTMICAGEMTRDQALEKLKTNPWKEDTIQQELDYVAKKLNISSDQLKQYVDNPPKYYWDYPNADRMLEFGYRVYRWLKRK
ncbi:hypothetical protein SDC9_95481 [bioreactor metagenome]|uniref:N-acetyl sugar amidotransferase n=1 Tax=bioreactor metagenome TaxID=1076179 RepID=A0A645AGH9_9ZZZZ